MSQLWSGVIRLIASDFPVLYADSLCGESPEPFERAGIMTPYSPRDLADCPECDEPWEIEVLNIKGKDELFCVCPEHGLSPVDPLVLRRWRLHLGPILDRFVEIMGIKGTRTQIVPDMVWKLGRQGRRDFIFVKYCWEEHLKATTAELIKHPKTVLVTITPESAARLSITLPNRKFSLVETTRYDPVETLVVDLEKIEAMIGEDEKKDLKTIPRRTVRIANIERLVAELKEHYRASKDHYFAVGRLLPRPTQAELARRTGLRQNDVSRCMSDPDAKILQLLWQECENEKYVLEKLLI